MKGSAVSLIIFIMLFCSNTASSEEIYTVSKLSKTPRHKVLVYCTHYWESFLPNLIRTSSHISAANDSKNNIIKVGKYLVAELQKQNISSLFAGKRYSARGAYSKSKAFVSTILKRNRSITYLIDIHRDVRRRYRSTLYKNGTSYAKIIFVVGSASKHFKKNKELAKSIFRGLNKQYPGLAQAIIIKNKSQYDNGEYNQSLAPHSLLIEVGGVDNSFAEAYRSVEILAKVLREEIIKNEEPSLP